MINLFLQGKWASSKSYHYGAKDPRKTHFFIREIGFGALWRTEPFSVILQPPRPQTCLPVRRPRVRKPDRKIQANESTVFATLFTASSVVET